jgi:protein-tyrosine phosphatase
MLEADSAISPKHGWITVCITTISGGRIWFDVLMQDTPDVQTMLDIVQVMDYSIKRDQNVAVHCHAGLGRTGLTIAWYVLLI